MEFFTAHIRNPGTRAVYARAVNRFCCWCDRRSVTLHQVSPFIVAGYIEQLTHQLSAPTVKLHLAAIRMLFDFLVVGQVLPVESSGLGPRSETRSQQGKDSRALRGRGETAPRFDRYRERSAVYGTEPSLV